MKSYLPTPGFGLGPVGERGIPRPVSSSPPARHRHDHAHHQLLAASVHPVPAGTLRHRGQHPHRRRGTRRRTPRQHMERCRWHVEAAVPAGARGRVLCQAAHHAPGAEEGVARGSAAGGAEGAAVAGHLPGTQRKLDELSSLGPAGMPNMLDEAKRGCAVSSSRTRMARRARTVRPACGWRPPLDLDCGGRRASRALTTRAAADNF